MIMLADCRQMLRTIVGNGATTCQCQQQAVSTELQQLSSVEEFQELEEKIKNDSEERKKMVNILLFFKYVINELFKIYLFVLNTIFYLLQQSTKVNI